LKRGAGRKDITQQSRKEDRIKEEGQPPGHWVKEERKGETSRHEESGGRKLKRKGSNSKRKNEKIVELRGRGVEQNS
jgi:hypothetical protein